jgi:hypothetical protein
MAKTTADIVLTEITSASYTWALNVLRGPQIINRRQNRSTRQAAERTAKRWADCLGIDVRSVIIDQRA